MTDARAEDVDLSNLPDWPLGPYLEAARKRNRLSQAQAAKLAGVSHAKLRQLERGYTVKQGTAYAVGTTKTTVERVANAVGADPRTALNLVGIEDDEPGRPGRKPQPFDLTQVSDDELLAEMSRRFQAYREALDQ
ncbi:helix-turn-helix domain-containing protein [Actinokineospora sp. G85]|uniref:helix-turn-helix domain-containing protein n=1 Tax=Actinokineospora sp. G85 TaxID=3406626 RepID=UPI003C77B4BF